MSLYFVDGVFTQGAETVIFAPSLANPGAPKLTEVGASATLAVNLSHPLRGFSPGGDQGSSDDIRLASKQTYENPGRFKPSIDDINYVYDPQAPTATAANKHYETLKNGVKGFVIDRRGVDVATIPAVGQKVDVYPVTCGQQRRAAVDAGAEGGKFEITQKLFVTGEVLYDVTLVA